ncbi:MAG TPA: NAD(P)H-binding protein [Terriglobales bacterium]|jgi:nucleoside-diphosphate-sugar epimerase|nr:NAD(P)H-binding protein [Terriglobales bacterium]
MPLDILISGGTGYVGCHLVPELLTRGHRVRVLTRAESAQRVTPGAATVIGNALDAESVAAAMNASDTVIHLVGTPHPSPSKADQFEKVDLVSIRATVSAAKQIGCSYLIYVSVAQPAPVMQAYLWVRALGEAMIREAGLTATIVRPWYVLGPGHWWPKALTPMYRLFEMIPATRATAQRLGLVTIDQMVTALVHAVENPPPQGQQYIVDVAAIRRAHL